MEIKETVLKKVNPKKRLLLRKVSKKKAKTKMKKINNTTTVKKIHHRDTNPVGGKLEPKTHNKENRTPPQRKR